VQPSSLVFLVLVAIWAVYLLQHWVRRREYLATAKSVDRFSAAMRVLERRHPQPEPDVAVPGTRSYDVSPARPSRGRVVVKPAEPSRSEVPIEPSAVVRPTRFFHFLAGMSARRLRGLSLLASLFVMIVVTTLAAVSAVPAWSILAVLAIVAADLVWLRHVAVSAGVGGWAHQGQNGQHQTAEYDAQHQTAEQESFAEPGSPARSAFGGSEFGADSRSDSQADFGSDIPFDSQSETLVGSTSRSPGGHAADPTLPMAAPAAGMTDPAEIPAYVDPSSWAPVPVPPPTYTLKAKAAERVVVVPPESAEPAASECWSLDGLVYDCELDELVERRSGTGA
jgi:hypothetical protein